MLSNLPVLKRVVFDYKVIFFDKIEQIAFMPLSGRAREDGTRETFVRRYRIVYDYDRQADEVIILAIIHSSRLYPRL